MKNYDKYTAYKFTISETEEILRNLLDDDGIYLQPRTNFYEAKSENVFLDGHEVDERLAQFLNVSKCEHYRSEDGIVVLVIEE